MGQGTPRGGGEALCRGRLSDDPPRRLALHQRVADRRGQAGRWRRAGSRRPQRSSRPSTFPARCAWRSSTASSRPACRISARCRRACALPACATARAMPPTASRRTSARCSASPRIRLRRSTRRSWMTASRSWSPRARSSRRPIHIVIVTGGEHAGGRASARADRGRREQPGPRRADVHRRRRHGVLQQRRGRSRGRAGRARRALHRSARVGPGVSRRQHPGARRRQGRVRVARVLDRRPHHAPRHRHWPQGRRRRLHHERRLPRRRRAPHGHAHLARSRDAALHQPRDLQGHPGRQGQGGVQRPHHRAARRAEDRRQADQPRAAAVGRCDHQLESAARDLRGRCEVHAWRGGGAVGRRGDVLPAGARPDPRRGPRHAAARVCRRGHRRPQDSGAARADRNQLLRARCARRGHWTTGR